MFKILYSVKIFDYKEKIINCINAIRYVNLNWMAVFKYLMKWIPFSIVVGLSIGLVAALFDYLLVEINTIITSNIYILHLFPFFVALITGLVISYDAKVSGPGISYVLNNINKSIKPKTLFYKFIISLFSLAGVFTAGREGPSFFMGSSISSFFARWFNLEEKSYIALIGAGAFTSALLKAPLGGALFALEIRYVSDMDYKPFPQILIASVFSYIVFSYFRGVDTFITLHSHIQWHFRVLPYLMLLGIVVAVFVYLFISSYHFANCVSDYIKPLYRPLVGVFLAVPIIYLLFSHDQYGMLSVSVNYQALNTIVQTQLSPQSAILSVFLVILLIDLTIGFGISGGLILPNLLIGALLGNAIGSFFPYDFAIFTLSGMAAMLAASAKTPIAAIVLILEISSTDIVIPITFAVIVSYIFTYGINIYTSQKVCRIDVSSDGY